MERYKLTFAYDGTRFFGSQRQDKTPTVQRELENALGCIGWQGKTILLAGRTDSGVHASGQVAAVDFEWQHSPEELLRAINAKLPSDIVCKNVNIVQKDFHPRFDAISRLYTYRIYCQPIRDPFRDRYAWKQWPSLKGELLRQAAEILIGTKDFAAFGTPPRKEQSTIRDLMSASWSLDGDEWIFKIQANAFLYHMVRRLVYFQVAIAKGRFPIGLLSSYLKEPHQKTISGLAPSNGLTLIKVTYPG